MSTSTRTAEAQRRPTGREASRRKLLNTTRTPERAEAFCATLAETCNVGKACKAAKIGRTLAYSWRQEDEHFAKAWDSALRIGISALEDEAHRRAFDGLLKPVYQNGKKVGSIREYSDTLAIFLLKAHDPQRYRDTGQQTPSPDLAALVAAILRQLSQGLPG